MAECPHSCLTSVYSCMCVHALAHTCVHTQTPTGHCPVATLLQRGLMDGQEGSAGFTVALALEGEAQPSFSLSFCSHPVTLSDHH